MQDLLRIADDGGKREVVLPRGLVTLGVNHDSTVQVQHRGAGLRPLLWDARRACWQLLRDDAAAGPLTINGRPVAGAAPVTLSHLDILETDGVQLQFERALDEPLLNGRPVREIPLGGLPLVFGGGKEPAAEPRLVRLDPEDPFISRLHARLVPDGDGYRLEDTSSAGTELNGTAFHHARLVFGDRFRISGYIFEFMGDAVHYIRPELTGTVAARELTAFRGAQCVLDKVSLNVGAGEFIGVLGRSGQGKTTLLNALCGVQPASAGRVVLGGVPLGERERLRAIGVGYVPQDDIVHSELTVEEAIRYSARLRVHLPRAQEEALVERTIGQLALDSHRHKRVEQLSGGQRKRVSIASELLARPNLLFLDEPSSGLDPATEAELMTLLQSLTLTKLTVICTTHVLHKAYLFDRMMFIEGGRLIFAGRSEEARLHFLAEENQESGSAETAPLEEIYTKLQKAERAKYSAARWEEDFRQSPFAARALPPLPERHGALAPLARQRKVGAGRAFRTLVARQWSILRADGMNLFFLIAQPVLIGLLLGWVASSAAQRLFLCVVATMWFGCSNGAQRIVAELPIFRRERICGQSLHVYLASKIGFLSALSLVQALLLLLTALTAAELCRTDKVDRAGLAKDFASRLTPIRIEDPFAGGDHFEVVGDASTASAPAPAPAASAPPPPVDPASLQVRALMEVCEFFGVSQNVLDAGPHLLKGSDGSPVKDPQGREIVEAGLPVAQVLWVTIGLRVLALAAAAFTSVGIGLAISALVKNATQAVLWVPLVLIPQILFGGILVSVPEMNRSVRLFSQLMPSFSAQRIMDTAAVFGQETPAMSNRTKTPLFLSATGEKETIEWMEDGESRTQDYDRLSPANASWQNLFTIPGRLGQHKWEKVANGEAGSTYPDSVHGRRDVLLHKSTPVRDFSVVGGALAALAAWCLACYAAMTVSLLRKEAK